MDTLSNSNRIAFTCIRATTSLLCPSLYIRVPESQVKFFRESSSYTCDDALPLHYVTSLYLAAWEGHLRSYFHDEGK